MDECDAELSPWDRLGAMYMVALERTFYWKLADLVGHTYGSFGQTWTGDGNTKS